MILNEVVFVSLLAIYYSEAIYAVHKLGKFNLLSRFVTLYHLVSGVTFVDKFSNSAFCSRSDISL